MRRTRTFKRGQIVPLILVGGIGYLIGGWHSSSRSIDVSAAQLVASRFPGDWNGTSSVSEMAAVAPPASAATAAPADAVAEAQLALFTPEPMVPQVLPQTPQPETQGPAPAQQDQSPDGPSAGAEPFLPSAAIGPVRRQRPAAAALHASEAKAAAAIPSRRVASRPGFMLNDAQIASIKQRLHLTSDQERMWPAVEAALRNIAYTRAQEARERGAAANSVQSAAVDPNAVQGLKSAAVPLILSFNAEQKEEVRNLAHVMGLDQLASEF